METVLLKKWVNFGECKNAGKSSLPEIHGIGFLLEPLILHHNSTFTIFPSQYYFVKMNSYVNI